MTFSFSLPRRLIIIHARVRRSLPMRMLGCGEMESLGGALRALPRFRERTSALEPFCFTRFARLAKSIVRLGTVSSCDLMLRCECLPAVIGSLVVGYRTPLLDGHDTRRVANRLASTYMTVRAHLSLEVAPMWQFLVHLSA